MTDVVCDLDGVIYRGDTQIDGAAEGLRGLLAAGANILFVTNNSTRPPHEVAEKIRTVTGVDVEEDQIVTSSQAAASLLSPDSGPVLLVGERGLEEAMIASDVETTTTPGEAGSVVVGLCRDLSYGLLADAADAIRQGARFIATNTDPTFPTATGLAPGAGSIVASIATTSGKEPEVAGKPHSAMRSLVRAKVGSNVWVIGDRLDTDIRMASFETGWRSILVLTGVSSASEAGDRPDYVLADFKAAVNVVLDGRQPR